MARATGIPDASACAHEYRLELEGQPPGARSRQYTHPLHLARLRHYSAVYWQTNEWTAQIARWQQTESIDQDKADASLLSSFVGQEELWNLHFSLGQTDPRTSFLGVQS